MFFTIAARTGKQPEKEKRTLTCSSFLDSFETFRAYFGWHNSLCIFKTKASRGTKPWTYFNFYLLYNIWKDQLHRISESEFYQWLFGPEKFSGLSRNGPQILTKQWTKTHTVLWVSHQNGGDLIIGLNHLAMWSSAWNNTYNADNLSPHKSYIS